jgi:hypothetical protein
LHWLVYILSGRFRKTGENPVPGHGSERDTGPDWARIV